MRAPRSRGTPIDAARIDEWVGRFASYRRRIARATIETWLAQFDQADRDVAGRLLDAVEFYGPEQLEAAFRSTLGALPGWHRSPSQRKGRWRFVPFSLRPGESGDSMLHVFRVANRLSSHTFDSLFVYKADLLREELGADDAVVFVDDFAGTGDQATSAWRESLGELLPGGPRVFLVLVAAVQAAVARIASDTPLSVRPYRRLRSMDNLFAAECSHFTQAEKRAILSYCRLADPIRPRGYGDCSLLFVMAHRCPNNSISILHRRATKFRGLFQR